MKNRLTPLPVTFVSTELGVGGAERCLAQLACHLDRQRFTPRVISLASPPDPARRQFVEQLDEAQIPIDYLHVQRPRQFLMARRRLRDRLRQARPAVVHSFLFHANVLTGWTLTGRNQVPHVLGVRVADPRRWRLQLERRVARRAAAITCVSEAVADHCRRSGYPTECLEVIPNGIDLAAVDALRASATKASRPRRVCLIGRLDPQKGTDRLPELAAAIWRRSPAAELVLAGDGPLADFVRGWLATPEVAARVRWLGWHPRPWELIRDSDLLALPSRFEGLANVVLEAMAFGKPVVAFDVEGVRELLGDDRQTRPKRPPHVPAEADFAIPAEPASFQRVPPGDLETMAERISQVLSSNALMKHLGGYNRSRVEQRFTLALMVQRYAELLERWAERKST